MWSGSQGAAVKPCRFPAPSCIPVLDKTEVAARYQGARVGGDFFDFLTPREDRLIALLVDIAGRREQALHLAAYLQDAFRLRVPQLFASDAINEAEAVTTLMVELNRALIEAAGGVHCAPAFLYCYDKALGVLTFINAGHIPGLLKDSMGVTELEAGGLPMGLFSHATHDAQVRVLAPGAVLLLVSKGLIETRSGKEEFGLERVKASLKTMPGASAEELCERVLSDARLFANERRQRFHFFGFGNSNHPEDEFKNDLTALALARKC